ncbi:MAG: Ig-like domain-containing protein [Pseudomonadota bacterium]
MRAAAIGLIFVLGSFTACQCEPPVEGSDATSPHYDSGARVDSAAHDTLVASDAALPDAAGHDAFSPVDAATQDGTATHDAAAADDSAVPADAAGADSALTDSAVADSAAADSAVADAAVADAAMTDSAVADAAMADSAVTDGATADSAVDDAAVSDAGGPLTTSAQIQALRDASPGTVDLMVQGATVTYVVPAVATIPPGFYIQAEQMGPAILVQVDPTSLTPAPVVGDVVVFHATQKNHSASSPMVTLLDGWARVDQGANIELLRQDLSNTTDLLSNIGDYDGELMSMQATLLGDWVSSGTGFVEAQIQTDGQAGNASFVLRIPATLQQDLRLALQVGRVIGVRGIFKRFNTDAQPSGWVEADLRTSPVLLRAGPAASNQITAIFSRNIDPATVTPAGTRFSLTAGLNVTAASASGNEVTLTTSSDLVVGTTYTLTVNAGVLATIGADVPVGYNTAEVLRQDINLVLNEVDYDNNGPDSNEFIEVRNNSASQVNLGLAGVELILYNGSATSGGIYQRIDLGPAGLLNAAAYLVVGSPNLGAGADIHFANADDNIQNGAPDGIALYSVFTHQLVDALSYEGAITAADIDGRVFSLVETTETTVSCTNGSTRSLCRLPDGTDTNVAVNDWGTCASPTMGTANQ